MASLTDKPEGVLYVTQAELIALQSTAGLLGGRPKHLRSQQSGAHLSSFKGRGMEFDEARPYQPGDDIRSMDWRVTARTNRPHSKVFREERERPVLVWVDFRASMFFGTRGCFKSVMAARLAAILGWSTYQQGDRLGALLFDERHHLEIRPKRGHKATLRVMRHLAEFSAAQPQFHADKPFDFDFRQPLNRMSEVTRPGSHILMISDFRGLDEALESTLARISRHNEVTLIQVFDPLEQAWPAEGRFRVTNGQSEAVLNATDAPGRTRYQEQFALRQERLQRLARKYRLGFHAARTDADLLQVMRHQPRTVSVEPA